MKNFSCPLCGREDYREVYPSTLGEALPEIGYEFSERSSKSYRVVSCDCCEHAFCTPRPEGLGKEYQDCDYLTYLSHTADREATAKKVLRILRRYKKSGRLLDIGCGSGDFIRIAGDCFLAEGLEPTQALAKLARDRGLEVHSTVLGEFRSAVRYDVVTLWGVVEHLEYPDDEISRIKNLLAPGGLVCVWTGDFKGIPSRLMRQKWWYIMGQHIQLFSRKSLSTVFRKHGFKEVGMHRYPYVMSLGSVAVSIKRYPFLSGVTRLLEKYPFLSRRTLTFKLPGEMYAVYEKM